MVSTLSYKGVTIMDNTRKATLKSINSSYKSRNSTKLPVGTIAQRPTPELGDLRFNSESLIFEFYNGNSWVHL